MWRSLLQGCRVGRTGGLATRTDKLSLGNGLARNKVDGAVPIAKCGPVLFTSCLRLHKKPNLVAFTEAGDC